MSILDERGARFAFMVGILVFVLTVLASYALYDLFIEALR